MSGLWDKIKHSLGSFMQGRYGVDSFSTMLMIVGLVLTVIASLTGLSVLSYCALAIMVYAIYRMYSKNSAKRSKELKTYLSVIEKPKSWFSFNKKKFENRDTTKYFKCEQCGTMLSVPIGKGKIRVTCPKCKNQSMRKS